MENPNDPENKPKPVTGSEAPATKQGERIAKLIARSGMCSRRQAEQWIEAGRVQVNGKKILSPALNVLASANIVIDGKPLNPPDPPRIWRYNKPAGLVTTERDPQGRATLFEKLPRELPRVMSIGRLDINTEGLLLLTNDGDLKRYIELPDTGWQRRYRVRAYGVPKDSDLIALKKGMEIDGIQYRSIDIAVERQQGGNAWMTVSLREGKNREIKKVLEHIGLQVNRLIRLSFGPFQLGTLEAGAVEEVPRRILREQLGAKWIELAAGFSTETSTQTSQRAPANQRPNLRLAAGKPDGKPSGKPGSKPGGKFAGKPAGNSSGKPGGRPARAGGRPTGKAGDELTTKSKSGYSKPGGKFSKSSRPKPAGRSQGDKPTRGKDNADRRR